MPFSFILQGLGGEQAAGEEPKVLDGSQERVIRQRHNPAVRSDRADRRW